MVFRHLLLVAVAAGLDCQQDFSARCILCPVEPLAVCFRSGSIIPNRARGLAGVHGCWSHNQAIRVSGELHRMGGVSSWLLAAFHTPWACLLLS